MNENNELELLDLESELSALRPVSPPAELLDKVDRELSNIQPSAGLAGHAEPDSNVIHGFFTRYGQLAAAAVLVLSSGLLFLVSQGDKPSQHPASELAVDQSPTVVNGSGFQRVGSSSSVSDPSDGGVQIEEGRAFRVLEYDVQEEQQWKNPAKGTEVKVKSPRKEQMLIPLPVF